MSGGQLGFSETEWATLKAGPAYVLSQVAGADSHVDRAEWAALVGAVQRALAHDDELVQSVMADVSEELEAGAPFEHMSGALDGLRAIRRLLAGRTDEGAGLREALLEMGATIAESSGAQMTRTFAAHHGQSGWTRSAGTSAMERAALDAAAEALGLS